MKNLVERTILVSGKSRLEASDFEQQSRNLSSGNTPVSGSFAGMTLEELEKQSIVQALENYKGNLSHVAVALGVSRAALYRWLEKNGIQTDK